MVVSGSKSIELIGAALEAGARWHVSKSDTFSESPLVLDALRRTSKSA